MARFSLFSFLFVFRFLVVGIGPKSGHHGSVGCGMAVSYPQFFLGCLYVCFEDVRGIKSEACGHEGEVMFVDAGRVVFPGGVLKRRGDVFLCEVCRFPRAGY